MFDGGAKCVVDGGPKAGCDARSGGPLLTGRDMRTDADEIHYAQNQVCSVVRAPAKASSVVVGHIACVVLDLEPGDAAPAHG